MRWGGGVRAVDEYMRLILGQVLHASVLCCRMDYIRMSGISGSCGVTGIAPTVRWGLLIRPGMLPVLWFDITLQRRGTVPQ